MFYQRQIDFVSGKVTAMAALVRWSHPRLDMVPPLDLIPQAEEARLMHSLTAVILERAVEQCAARRSARELVTVSVNLAATNLFDAGCSELVYDGARRPQCPALMS